MGFCLLEIPAKPDSRRRPITEFSDGLISGVEHFSEAYWVESFCFVIWNSLLFDFILDRDGLESVGREGSGNGRACHCAGSAETVVRQARRTSNP